MGVQKRVGTNGRIRWVARYRDKTGKEHSKSFPTRREASAYLTEQQRAVRRNEWIAPEERRLTVGELMTDWVASSTRKPGSVTKYENTIANLGDLALVPATSVTPQDVTVWYRVLVGGRPWMKNKPLSEATAITMLKHVRAAYAWLADQGVAVRNPVVVPKRAESSAVLPEDIPTREQIDAVIRCVREGGAEYRHRKQAGAEVKTYVQGANPTVADMLTMGMLTGLRVSELAGLTVGDVDLIGGVVKVRKQLGAGAQRVSLKSARSRRDVPIIDDLAPMLQVLTVGKAPSDFLFVQASRRPWPVSRLSVIVKRARGHVGAPTVHFHALRHFFASRLLTAGVPVHEVAGLLGHSSAVLLSTYAHVLPGSVERGRAAIAAAVSCGQFAGSEIPADKVKPRLRR